MFPLYRVPVLLSPCYSVVWFVAYECLYRTTGKGFIMRLHVYQDTLWWDIEKDNRIAFPFFFLKFVHLGKHLHNKSSVIFHFLLYVFALYKTVLNICSTCVSVWSTPQNETSSYYRLKHKIHVLLQKRVHTQILTAYFCGPPEVQRLLPSRFYDKGTSV